ncbi:hypothetical protein ACYPKM_02105 [Pseudomonas aeruginosa]
MGKKIFKLYSGEKQLLGIIAAESERDVWIFAQGAKLPLASTSEIDINHPNAAVVVLAEAHKIDGEALDHMKRRQLRSEMWVLKG